MNSIFGIIYKATNICNNKSYIGQTTRSLSSRINEHYSKASNAKSNKTYFAKALLKYNKKVFTWEILEICTSKEELDEMEYHYIRQYNTFAPIGYNLTYGGEGSVGYKHTKNSLSKM